MMFVLCVVLCLHFLQLCCNFFDLLCLSIDNRSKLCRVGAVLSPAKFIDRKNTLITGSAFRAFQILLSMFPVLGEPAGLNPHHAFAAFVANVPRFLSHLAPARYCVRKSFCCTPRRQCGIACAIERGDLRGFCVSGTAKTSIILLHAQTASGDDRSLPAWHQKRGAPPYPLASVLRVDLLSAC